MAKKSLVAREKKSQVQGAGSQSLSVCGSKFRESLWASPWVYASIWTVPDSLP